MIIKPADITLPLGTNLAQSSRHDEQSTADCLNWLSFHRVWGSLDRSILQALSQSLQLLQVPADTEIYQQEQTAIGLYLLKWGSVEIYLPSSVGRSHISYRSAGELLGYVPLVAASSEQQSNDSGQYQASAIALSASELWFLRRADFERLLQTYPSLQSLINQLLAQDLRQFVQRISQTESRMQGLQRYLQPVPIDEPLMTRSKAGKKLHQQIESAATTLNPIVFQAAAGTGKTFLAGYIHQHSGLCHRPFAEIDCAQLPRDDAGIACSDPLFGSGKDSTDRLTRGVLELLERGTLLIDNVHLLTGADRDRLTHYLQTGTFTRNPASLENSSTRPSTAISKDLAIATPVDAWVRLILAQPTPLALPEITCDPRTEGLCHRLKLFNLSQRKEDIPAFAQYFLQKFCQIRSRPALTLDPGELRRLISYPYPGNLSELAGILKRVVTMTPIAQSYVSEQVLWSVQSEKNAFRIDLLDQFPWLRKFLLSRWWPERFWIAMMVIFVPVTVMGLIGPQSREASVTLNFFWAWWWPFYLFFFVFIGRLWCSVCPFMITAEWLRKLSLWIWPRQLKPWPTKWLNRWGAWVLFAGFVLIYLWEHLWDLPHTAYLSAWLLLAITAGAVISSLIYERRLWCRYLCPIGGMNGMFAKLSMIEVRSTQQVCGSQCTTFGCYKGSDATPVTFAEALPTEGQATGGCPLYSHPAQLQDNRDCILCMTCLKACPHRSVQVNLRFPAADLLENHQGFWAEVALLLLLLGGVFMHHDQQILSAVGLGPLLLDSDHLRMGVPVVVVLLGLPAALTYGVHAIARLIDPKMPDYLTVVYAYLPFALAANLADYIPAALTEAGKILPVTARTFGYSGVGLPTLTWGLEVAGFLQGVTLLSAWAFSLYPLLRITSRPWWSILPHIGLMTALTALYFYLLI